MVENNSIQDWDALAREVRLIWDNAKEYNQEGSDIYNMAENLEVWTLYCMALFRCLADFI